MSRGFQVVDYQLVTLAIYWVLHEVLSIQRKTPSLLKAKDQFVMGLYWTK